MATVLYHNANLHSTVNNTIVVNTMSGTSATNSMIVWGTFPTTATTGTISNVIPHFNNNIASYFQHDNGKLNIEFGHEIDINLPDDTLISVKADGSYKIIDTDGKIKYKGNPLREFNPYINASDMLEEFVDFVASVGGVSKRSFLDLPIELFIRWLVIRAAEADGDDLPEDQSNLLTHPALLPAPVKKQVAQCKCCGRFITKKRAIHSIFFCSTEHLDIFSQKIAV